MVTVNGDQSLAQRAQVMRAEGATYAQIKAALGVGSSTVSRLLGTSGKGRPAPRIPAEVREEACELRRQGLSVPEIARELGIARSTAWLITKDIPWTPTRDPAARRAEGARSYWRAESERRDRSRRQAQSAAAESVGHLSDRELLLAGAALYWAEGSKAKPWRRQERLVFTNSDPDVIRLYLAWLRLLGVSSDQLTYRVGIHESANVVAAERYWAEIVGITPEALAPTSLKRHRPVTSRRNTGDHYHGCLVVRVRRSAELYWKMSGLWSGLVSSLDRGRTGEP